MFYLHSTSLSLQFVYNNLFFFVVTRKMCFLFNSGCQLIITYKAIIRYSYAQFGILVPVHAVKPITIACLKF